MKIYLNLSANSHARASSACDDARSAGIPFGVVVRIVKVSNRFTFSRPPALPEAGECELLIILEGDQTRLTGGFPRRQQMPKFSSRTGAVATIAPAKAYRGMNRPIR